MLFKDGFQSFTFLPVLLLSCIITLTACEHNINYPSTTGSYCSSRAGEKCCIGRKDECSVPFFDTLCYCDVFCDRSRSPDCCPDFRATCQGVISSFKDNNEPDGVRIFSDDEKYEDWSRYHPHSDNHDTRNHQKVRHEETAPHRGIGGRNSHHTGAWDDSPLNIRGDSDSDEMDLFRKSDWEHDEGVPSRDENGFQGLSLQGRDSHGYPDNKFSRLDDDGRGHHVGYGNEKTEDLKNNCFHHGRLYQPGDGIKENCNNCTCVNAILKQEYNWKCTQKICLIRPELLQNIATSNLGWTAKNYSFFWGLSAEEGRKYKLGTFPPIDRVNKMTMLKVHVDDEVPDEFDSRQHWSGLISPVQDQHNCAASWAYSTASVATDRLRIHSNGAYKDITLSTQQLIACNGDHGQHGCASGHTDRAWWFMRKIGLVSEGCYPSEHHRVSWSSSHHDTSNVKAECLMPRSYQALKEAQCPNQGIKTTVYQASPPYKIAPNEREIMNEILENGPVQAIMEVKEDFYMYQSGVYQYSLPADYDTSEHRKDKHHSVRILGWGVDRTTAKPLKYWLCANSWGSGWGEDGYFRILRGADESSIESAVVGVWLKVNDRMLVQRQKPSWSDRKKKHQRGQWRDDQAHK